jgi:hypothetical protein
MIEKYLMPDTIKESSRPILEKQMMNSDLIPYKYKSKIDKSLYGN